MATDSTYKMMTGSSKGISQMLKDAGNPDYKNPAMWDHVRELNSLNSSYTVYASRKYKIPTVGLSALSSSSSSSNNTSTAPLSTGTDSEQVNEGLGNYQDDYLDAIDSLEESIRTPEEIRAEVETELGDLEVPEAPDLSEMYKDLSTEYGLDAINTMLNDLQARRDALQLTNRRRLEYSENQPVSMDVIGGQQSEIQRQTDREMESINYNINVLANQQQSALQIINLMMDLEQTDYQNAMTAYNTRFNNKLQQIQLINDMLVTERQFGFELKQWEQDVASAQIGMYIDLITSGSMILDDLSTEERARISQLEIQSGLGLGFLSKVEMSPEAMVQSITQRQGSDGYMYSDVVTVGADGKIEVQSLKLGRFYVAPRTTGTTTKTNDDKDDGSDDDGETTQLTARQEYEADKASVSSFLNSVTGSDDKVSPDDYKKARNKWIEAGYSKREFTSLYGKYRNMKHFWNYL